MTDAGLHPVIRLAPAKVNLTLAVGPRRPDGFHELHSVMVPIGLADRLSVALAHGSADSLHVTGDAGPPRPDDLVLRGIAAARDAVRVSAGPATPTPPLAARLEKRIPIAAGLAGGSSDAAAAIEAALEAWGVRLSGSERIAAAATVGSDVPFFLAHGLALVEGRGERVTPLHGLRGPAPGILIVTPRLPVSTTAVFARLDSDPAAAPADRGSSRITSLHLADELQGGLTASDLVVRAGVLSTANDLVHAASAAVPELRGFRRSVARLLGRPVGQSGSGPSLWALYPSATEAEAGAAAIEAALREGRLAGPGDGPPRVVATTIGMPAPDEPTGRDG